MRRREFKEEVKSPLPLYAQLKQYLITQIRNGVYSPDELLPSITEIEDRVELGRVTIVRAMQELVKDGYATGIHGKGYYVAQRGAKPLIGIVAPFNTVYMQIYVHLAAGVRNAADKLNCEVIIKSSEENPRTFMQAVEEFVNYRGCRCLIVVPPMDMQGNVSRNSLNRLRILKKLKDIRYAVIDRTVPVNIFQVHQDRFEGNMLLIKQASAKNCRKILFLDRVMVNPNFGGPKLFERLVKEARNIDSDMKMDYAVPVSAEEDLKLILSEKYDAVFADDLHARKIVNMAGAARTFHIAGYNGMAAATAISPRITTVNSNLTAAGQIAVDYLFDKKSISGKVVNVKPYLVEGETF
jgi:DNA-binding transcriptional regulator YhcF (GntR family)